MAQIETDGKSRIEGVVLVIERGKRRQYRVVLGEWRTVGKQPGQIILLPEIHDVGVEQLYRRERRAGGAEQALEVQILVDPQHRGQRILLHYPTQAEPDISGNRRISQAAGADV